MSNLTYHSFPTFNTSPTPSTYHSSSHISPMMMRNSRPGNWTNLYQLQETDGKLKKSYSLDSNLELDKLGMKVTGKVMRIKTIAESMLKILMNSSKQTSCYIVISPIPTNSESQANPYKQGLKEQKPSDTFRKKD